MVTWFPIGLSKNLSPSEDKDIMVFSDLIVEPVIFSKLKAIKVNRRTIDAAIITFLFTIVYITFVYGIAFDL